MDEQSYVRAKQIEKQIVDKTNKIEKIKKLQQKAPAHPIWIFDYSDTDSRVQLDLETRKYVLEMLKEKETKAIDNLKYEFSNL